MTLDFSADYDAVFADDFGEAVAFTSSHATTPVSVALTALRFVQTTREASPTNGAYTAGEMRWSLSGTDLPGGMVPKPGDSITDSTGRVFRVTRQAGWHQVVDIYHVDTVDVAIQEALQDLVTVERASWSKGTSHDTIRVWDAVAIHLPARIQRLSIDLVQERGQEYGGERLEVTLGLRLADIGSHEHRIVNEATGEVLDVVSVGNLDRIDQLPVCVCARKP